MPDGSTRTVALIDDASRGRVEHVTVQHLVEAAHARLLAAVPPQPGTARRAQSLLDAVEVLEVLFDDQPPLMGAPIGVPLAFGQRSRFGALGLLLHRPEVEDAGVGI